jgi:hypothetical protein
MPWPFSTRTSPGCVPGATSSRRFPGDAQGRRPERRVGHRERSAVVVAVPGEARVDPDADDDERVAALWLRKPA